MSDTWAPSGRVLYVPSGWKKTMSKYLESRIIWKSQRCKSEVMFISLDARLRGSNQGEGGVFHFKIMDWVIICS